jgi:glycosyltransferase involved in cell wall biosynthesis
MSFEITPLILTYNEAPNLARTLGRLAWARDIVIVDSHSTDETCAIAGSDARVRLFQRVFTTHAEQWQFGLEHTGISTDWVLALDADFVLSDPLVAELTALQPGPDVAGYRAAFRYCIDGRPLRGAAYPPVTVLYRRARARYEQDGHTQRVCVDGRVEPLSAPIFHDDRKDLTHWLAAQSRYARLEAEKLAQTPSGQLGWLDRLRKWIVVTPPAMFIYCYVVRGGLLDGRAGLFYALQRAAVEAITSLYLVERMMRRVRHTDSIS